MNIVLSDKQNAQKYFDKIRREINYGVKFQNFSRNKYNEHSSSITITHSLLNYVPLFLEFELSTSAFH